MPQSFHILVPLQNMRWGGDLFEIVPGINVRRRRELPPLSGLEKQLAPDEQRRISRDVTHWLEFDQVNGSTWSASETTNMLLLALWLVRPTRTEVSFRFSIGFGETKETRLNRLLDRMQWINTAVESGYTTSDLEFASSYFKVLRIIAKPGRLNNAVVLTLQACWQSQWQAALVLFATSAEALLTFSSDSGLSRRLAITYACLTETSAPERDQAFSHFRDCYKARSDVVHGRGMYLPEDERLRMVAKWAGILRGVWRIALGNSELLQILEGTDVQRKAFFKNLIAGYKD